MFTQLINLRKLFTGWCHHPQRTSRPNVTCSINRIVGSTFGMTNIFFLGFWLTEHSNPWYGESNTTVQADQVFLDF